MDKFKKFIDHFEEYLLLPSFTFTVALIFIQVIMRFVFKNSISWSEELARYIFVWQLWLGVGYATKNASHIRITMLRKAFKEKGQKRLEAFAIIVWFAFGCFVILRGWETAQTIARFGQTSPALKLPMQYAYMSVPVGACLMNLRLIQNFVKLFKSPKEVINEEVKMI